MMDLASLVQLLMQFIFVFIVSIVFSLFSPLGIGFIIFSIIRRISESEVLKRVSLVFQILLTCLTFLIGVSISLLFLFRGSPFYVYGYGSFIYMLAVLFGVFFVTAINVGIIIWGTRVFSKK